MKKSGLMLEAFEDANMSGCEHSIKNSVKKCENYTVTTVYIENEEDARRFEREKGTYITIEMNTVSRVTDYEFEAIVSEISENIKQLACLEEDSCVIVVGIGNRNVSADSLGPKCIDRIIVTRGLMNTMPELIKKGSLANVCAISSNVFGITGIESAELVKGVSSVISPELIVVIDALSTTTPSRLCKTIQISDTSLIPGGGVGNTREKICPTDKKTKIISIGMPTVMNCDLEEANSDCIISVMNIDLATDIAAKLIAFSLNKSFHYDMSTEDILKFLY